MIEEIDNNLYKIEVPLPGSPLKTLNSYMIKDSKRNLVIDTGWNHEECLRVIQGSLKKLGMDVGKTDFFITHSHSDHLGLVSELAPDTATVYFSEIDANRVKAGFHWDDLIHFARLSGFPEDGLQNVVHSHPGLKYGPKKDLAFHLLKEGDVIRVGDNMFQCIETPGHTRGHMCLFEPKKKIFVSGDLLLNDITPNIQLWSDDWNPLKEYLASLDKMYGFNIELVLTGHRSMIRNAKSRINELRSHHQKRLDEILTILKNGHQNAYQIGSQMHWDLRYDSWDLFPILQKWFATGEAISHLKYLEEQKTIRKEIHNQKILFSL